MQATTLKPVFVARHKTLTEPEEKRLIARVRELSSDSLEGAIERGYLLKRLNLAWHEYESKRVGITYSTGYQLMKLVDHPRMAKEDWERPCRWTVTYELLQVSDKCFEAMRKAGFVNYHTSRRQVRDFVRTWKRRAQIKVPEKPSLDRNVDGFSIYNEDCLAGMARIPDHSVDLVLADLPFGQTQNVWDTPIALEPLWQQYKRVIRPNGAIVLTAQIPFSIVLASSNLPWLKYEWIWIKEQGTGFLNAKIYPLKIHENILVFCEGVHTYNPQMEPGKPYRVLSRKPHTGSNYGECNTVSSIDTHERFPKTVLNFDHDKESHIHPTQKPVALFEYLVRTYTNPGELVLDNCMGSGTTGVACINADRRFIGYELDPDYFAAANDRLEHHQKQSKDRLADPFES